MNEVKYTNDGKKVVVLGKLNAQESIVQEFFVTEKGAEIPSGENFVVKSLHDEPVMTYKDKREKELEQQIKRLENEIKQQEKEIREHHELVTKPLAEKAKCIKAMIGDKADSYKQLIDFITGNIKYIVFTKWGCPEIKTFDEFLKTLDKTDSYYGEKRYDGLRLISLFGGSNGKVDYKLSQYSDGSGSNEEIHPASSLDEAVEIVTEILSKQERYTNDIVKLMNEYSIKMDNTKYREWYIRMEQELIKSAEKAKQEIDEKRKEAEEKERAIVDFRNDNKYPEDK